MSYYFGEKQLCFGIERLFQQVINCCIYINTQHNNGIHIYACNTIITHVINTWTCVQISRSCYYLETHENV